MPVAYSPPPNILEKRGNVSQNPFCSLWPNKKGHGSRIWFILGHCENKGSLYKLECCAPRMVLSTPVGRTEKCRKELFSPRIHSSCSCWHGEFQLAASVLIFSYASCGFWLSGRSSHSQQWSISTIYNFSNYFNKGNMAIPILKVLWKFETENSRRGYCICIGVGLWACVLHWCLGECLHLKLNYSRKVNLTMLVIFK